MENHNFLRMSQHVPRADKQITGKLNLMNLSEFDLSVLYGAAHTVPDNETCIVLNENPAFIFKCDK